MSKEGMPWYRIDTDFERHPKVRKLADSLKDPNAAIYVVRLWSWTGRYAPNGKTDASDMFIERELFWNGASGALVSAMVDLKILDRAEGGLVIHGWRKRNAKHFDKFKKDRAKRKDPTSADDPKGTRKKPVRVPRGKPAEPESIPSATVRHGTSRTSLDDLEVQDPTDTHTPSPMLEIEPWPTSATSPVIAPQAPQSTTTPPNGEVHHQHRSTRNVGEIARSDTDRPSFRSTTPPPQREDEHPPESTQSLGGIVKNGTMHTPRNEITPPDLSAKSGNLPITAPGRTGGSHTPTPPTGIATTGTGGASGNGSKPDPVGRSEWCESVEASWPPRVVEVFLAWRSTFVAPDVKPPKLRQSDHDPIAAALRWDFEPSDIADSFHGWRKSELRAPNGMPIPEMTSIKSLLKTPDVITQGIMHAKARVGVAPSTRPESRTPVSDLPPKIDPALAKAKLAEMRRNKSQETPNEI